MDDCEHKVCRYREDADGPYWVCTTCGEDLDAPPECEHEDTDTYIGPAGPETRCFDCGENLDGDGPGDDRWIARAYLRAADLPRKPDTLVEMNGR